MEHPDLICRTCQRPRHEHWGELIADDLGVAPALMRIKHAFSSSETPKDTPPEERAKKPGKTMTIQTSPKTLTIQLDYETPQGQEPGVRSAPRFRVFLGDTQIGSLARAELRVSSPEVLREVELDFCDITLSEYGQLPPEALSAIEGWAASLQGLPGVKVTTPRTRLSGGVSREAALNYLIKLAREIQRELKKGECNLPLVLEAELDDALMELGIAPEAPP